MKTHLLMASILLALAALPAHGADATFERTLTVSGPVELSVATGAGAIRLSVGAGDRIHVVGHIRSTGGGSSQQVSALAAHPPIEQTGNIVRIGVYREGLRNIVVDYDVTAPANAFLDAGSGSGSVVDDGVGANANLHTGSGSIHATGLGGGFSLGTGSGSIYAEQVGDGDIKAETGSGSIELRNVHGALRAQTGAGSIKIGGTPAGPWHIETGSGSVDLWTGNAPFTLDAECGGGSIHSDREITTQGAMERRHLKGKIGAGGPTVRVETGSGSIRIH